MPFCKMPVSLGGETVLDVGCGYGPLAFGTLPLVGAQGEVLFCDTSPGLLEHCRALASKLEVLDRCQFLAASADDLALVETNALIRAALGGFRINSEGLF